MKKVLGILCALMLTALSLLSASAYDKANQKGDADMNGRITIDDATLIQRYVAELVACDGFWPLFTADADNNGVVNINDVSLMQRHLAQFGTTLTQTPDGNATIAQAAVTLAYAERGMGYLAPGKQIYRDVFDLTIGDDDYMRSCDRFVCTAIRWSGADDNYPEGHVGVQAEYLDEHPEKWLDLFQGRFLSSEEYRYAPPEGLQPGDVIMEYRASDYRTHTAIYCGEGLIATIYPESADAGYEVASASYDDTAPQCTYWYMSSNYFRVFRCKQYETDSRYKNALQ